MALKEGEEGVALKVGERAASHLIPPHAQGNKNALSGLIDFRPKIVNLTREGKKKAQQLRFE